MEGCRCGRVRSRKTSDRRSQSSTHFHYQTPLLPDCTDWRDSASRPDRKFHFRLKYFKEQWRYRNSFSILWSEAFLAVWVTVTKVITIVEVRTVNPVENNHRVRKYSSIELKISATRIMKILLLWNILPVSWSCLGEAAWVRGAHLVALCDQVSTSVDHGEHTGLTWPGPTVHCRAGEPRPQQVGLTEEVEEFLHTWLDIFARC